MLCAGGMLNSVSVMPGGQVRPVWPKTVSENKFNKNFYNVNLLLPTQAVSG